MANMIMNMSNSNISFEMRERERERERDVTRTRVFRCIVSRQSGLVVIVYRTITIFESLTYKSLGYVPIHHTFPAATNTESK